MIDSGKGKKILNDLAREWHEFKVIEHILPLRDLLERASSMSCRLTLLGMLVSVVTILPTKAAYEKGFSDMNMVKAASGHHCRQAALMIQW
jgi:hypothetical protein